MKILLLRHGETAGNREKRYVGCRTDEGLTETEKERLRTVAKAGRGNIRKSLYPIDTIYVSPMRRCLETEAILFSASELSCIPVIADEGLAECDFGLFEGKNYLDLNGSQEYQRFIDSGGTDGFPGGEAVDAFKRRCACSFGKLVNSRLTVGGCREETLVFVVHGGTIMAVLEAFARPQKDYYSWHVKNAEGYLCEVVRDGSEPSGFFLSGCEKFEFII